MSKTLSSSVTFHIVELEQRAPVINLSRFASGAQQSTRSLFGFMISVNVGMHIFIFFCHFCLSGPL